MIIHWDEQKRYPRGNPWPFVPERLWPASESSAQMVHKLMIEGRVQKLWNPNQTVSGPKNPNQHFADWKNMFKLRQSHKKVWSCIYEYDLYDLDIYKYICVCVCTYIQFLLSLSQFLFGKGVHPPTTLRAEPGAPSRAQEATPRERSPTASHPTATGRITKSREKLDENLWETSKGNSSTLRFTGTDEKWCPALLTWVDGLLTHSSEGEMKHKWKASFND